MEHDITASAAYERMSIRKAFYLVFKRIFDIIVGLIGVLFVIPLALIIKIAYLLHGDTYTIWLVHDRVGKNGKTFKFIKFRSMVPHADDVLYKMFEENPELKKEYEISMKLENDPRITKVGKFIRKTSIDELPQFINILKGDMSLIGNRPYMLREVDKMGGFFNDIVRTKPGLTGYWQVNGRSEVTFIDRCRMEAFYSKNAGLKMDLKIFFKTFKVVLSKVGAK